MSNQKVIEAVKNLKPQLCHNFYIYWNRKDGKHFFNVKTNEFVMYGPHNQTHERWLTRSTSSSYQPIATVNIYEDVLEFAIVFVDLHTVKGAEGRTPTYAIPDYNKSIYRKNDFPLNRLFIIKNDTNIYDAEGNVIEKIACGGNFKKFKTVKIENYIENLIANYSMDSTSLIDKIAKFNGSDKYLVGNESQEILVYMIDEWLRSRKSAIDKSPQQKKKEELFSIKVNDIKVQMSEKSICYMQDTEKYTVLRIFKKVFTNNYGVFSAYEMKEGKRIFIPYDKKATIVGYSRTHYGDVQNNWSLMSFGSDYKDRTKISIIGTTKNEIINTRALPNESARDTTIGVFLSSMKFPIVEQMVKIGWGKIAQELCSDNKSVILRVLNLTMNQKSLRGLAFNKFQMDMINKKIPHKIMNVVESFVYVFGINYIHIDDATSKIFIDIYEHIFIKLNSWYSSIDRFIPNNIPQENRFQYLKKLYALVPENAAEGNCTNPFTVMGDAIRQYTYNAPAEPLPFDYKGHFTMRDVMLYHDRCVEHVRVFREMSTLQRNTELEKAYKKNLERRKVLEYEDEKYIIRLPESCTEIVKEGASLHHCVSGYAEDHAKGHTTIMFLRDKANPDESLATIEVRGSSISQIHLKYNAWLGTRPELVPTVMRWIRDKKLECADHILLSTSKTYGGGYTAPRIPKPAID